MFHYTIHLILISFIYVTHVNSFVANLDSQKNKEIRPKHNDDYKKCPYQICTQVKDYPEMEILEQMRNKETLRSMLGNVLNFTYDVTSMEDRDGINSTKYPLCKTVGTTTYEPRVMMNLISEWKFVVNVKGYKQIFTSETCSDKALLGETNNGECFRNKKHKKVDFKCEQSSQEMYLLVFEDNKIDFDKFKIPTTCNSVLLTC